MRRENTGRGALLESSGGEPGRDRRTHLSYAARARDRHGRRLLRSRSEVAAGGGGKGFRVVREAGEAELAFESASREGEAYFSDSAVYVERYLEDPRHVEVQVLADAHGNA